MCLASLKVCINTEITRTKDTRSTPVEFSQLETGANNYVLGGERPSQIGNGHRQLILACFLSWVSVRTRGRKDQFPEEWRPKRNVRTSVTDVQPRTTLVTSMFTP